MLQAIVVLLRPNSVLHRSNCGLRFVRHSRYDGPKWLVLRHEREVRR
ncbi:MAG TPA: hypothetical protein VEI07_10830 [Planctomycetaceae bacterium]|nr:hypothetical protein [Planctomycetaceae bacterium]